MNLELPTGRSRRSSIDDLFSPEPEEEVESQAEAERSSASASVSNHPSTIATNTNYSNFNSITTNKSASARYPFDKTPSQFIQNTTNANPITAKEGQERTRNILSQHQDIKIAKNKNSQEQWHTIKLLSAMRNAYKQVDDVQNKLELADQIEQEDSELAVVPFSHHQKVSLPRFPRLVDSIPLLRVHADENLEFRQLTTVVVWLSNDVAALKKAVLSECKRVFMKQILKDPTILNPKEILENLSEDELLIVSLPFSMKRRLQSQRNQEGNLEHQNGIQINQEESQDEEDNDEDDDEDETKVNWKSISKSVGTHSSKDCRTKWLMNERTDLENKTWNFEEQKKLKEIVEDLFERKENEKMNKQQTDKSSSNDQVQNNGKNNRNGLMGNGSKMSSVMKRKKFIEGEERNWEEIARILNTGRNGAQCLMAYTRSSSQVRADQWTEQEDQELLRLIKVYGPRWGAISDQLSTNREPYKCQHRYVTALDSTIYKGKWFSNEDSKLISAMKLFGKDTKDWTKVSHLVPGRTSQQCRERWKGRLCFTTDLNEISDRVEDAVEEFKDKDSDGVGIRNWSEAEDERLIECAGKNWTWVQVADHVGNRSDKQARDRFLVLKKRIEKRKQDESQTDSIAGSSTSTPTSTPSKNKRKVSFLKKTGKGKRSVIPNLDEDLDEDLDSSSDPDPDPEATQEIIEKSRNQSKKRISSSEIEIKSNPKPKPKPKSKTTSNLNPTTNLSTSTPKAAATAAGSSQPSKLSCPEFTSEGLPCSKTFSQFRSLKTHLMKVHDREIQSPKLMRKFESGEKQAEKRRDGRRGGGGKRRKVETDQVKGGVGDNRIGNGEEEKEEEEDDEDELELDSIDG